MAESDYCGPAPPEIRGETSIGFSVCIPGKIEKITFGLKTYESKKDYKVKKER
jgi:hypothetical protein